MKQRIITSIGLAVLAGVSLVTPALAVVSMSWTTWTTIGNVNNLADSTGYGAVDHAYKIGTYEVTNAQYVDFLNAKGASNSSGIYNSTMGTAGTYGSNITRSGVSGSYSYSVGSTYANMPVVGVTWFDAARFSNWLGNGQGSASMETGAYTLNGATSGIIMVNLGAMVYIPSENEWYKAAYYNATTSTYSLYPNGRNTITTADANYYPSATGLVNVGYGTPSSYGTYGQGGNAWEWHEAVISGSNRGLRGGSWLDDVDSLVSSSRNYFGPSRENDVIGFRVASVIPEPSCVVLTLLASGVLVTRRKR
ncbi:MAG: formylglycine-generating enzyme family protein [Verrucomicrobia bacterium]|nr:formylglycine-generating enzyme family protein [Verrucomicrobiota bacterium]